MEGWSVQRGSAAALGHNMGVNESVRWRVRLQISPTSATECFLVRAHQCALVPVAFMRWAWASARSNWTNQSDVLKHFAANRTLASWSFMLSKNMKLPSPWHPSPLTHDSLFTFRIKANYIHLSSTIGLSSCKNNVPCWGSVYFGCDLCLKQWLENTATVLLLCKSHIFPS